MKHPVAGVTVSNKIWELFVSEELDYLRLKGKIPAEELTNDGKFPWVSSTLFHCLFRGSYGQQTTPV